MATSNNKPFISPGSSQASEIFSNVTVKRSISSIGSPKQGEPENPFSLNTTPAN